MNFRVPKISLSSFVPMPSYDDLLTSLFTHSALFLLFIHASLSICCLVFIHFLNNLIFSAMAFLISSYHHAFCFVFFPHVSLTCTTSGIWIILFLKWFYLISTFSSLSPLTSLIFPLFFLSSHAPFIIEALN